MRVAFFNWRDIRNPLAGGAEAYNHRMLRCLVEGGHEATIFSSTFSGCARRERIEGIEHVRYAGRFMMYPESFMCYRRHVRGKYDVVVEGINGLPFFTPLFSSEPVVPLVYQLTRKNWYSGLPFPLAFMGYHLEEPLLRAYAGLHAATISESTRLDLRRLGFRKVSVFRPAADISPPARTSKEKEPTLVYLGRLTKSKRVSHVLEAFSMLKRRFGGAKLWIVGSGPEEGSLKGLALRLGISADTTFFGHVPENRKAELLSRASLLLFPAVHEGWGMTVLEANACGTPAIGYDVPGLRDSIVSGSNGYLVKDGDVASMAGRAAGLLENGAELRSLSLKASAYSRMFSWDDSAKGFLSLLEGVV